MVAFAETGGVVGESDVAALRQTEGGGKIWITAEPGGFILTKLDGLMGTDDGRQGARALRGKEKVSRDKLAGLALKADSVAEDATREPGF
jgi:hypothetical protein